MYQDDEYTYSPPAKPVHAEDGEYTYTLPKQSVKAPDWGENASPNAWSENPTKPKKQPQYVDKSYTGQQGDGFDPTDAETLAKYGVGTPGAPKLTPGQSTGAAFIARHTGPGTFLGDASNTALGREAMGLMDLPMGVAQGLSHLTGNGQEADAYVRLREGLIQANQGDQTRAQLTGMQSDPLRTVGNFLLPIPGGGAARGIKGVAQAAGIGGALGFLQPNANVQYDDQGRNDYLGSATGGGLKSALVNTGLHALLRGGGNLIAGRTARIGPGNVNSLGEDISQNLSKSASDDVASLTSIAGSPSIRSAKAQAILNELQQAGNDPTRQLQLSARAKKLMEQHDLDAMFTERDKAMQGVTSTAPRTVATLNDEIAQLERNPYPNQSTLAQLKTFRNRLTGNPDETSALVGPMGETLPSNAPPVQHNFQDLSRARASVKEDVRGFYTGQNATTGSLGAAESQRIANALSEDLASAARLKGGNAQALDEAANQAYSGYKTKWNAPSNRSLITSTTPDELLSPILKFGEDRAQNAQAALTPMGHDSVRAMVYQKLMDESGGDPSKFLAALKPMKKAMPTFFEGAEGAKLDGLTKIMQTSSNVGNMSGPVAGATAGMAGGPFGMMGGAIGGGILGKLHMGEGASSSQVVSRMTKWLLSTPTGQQYLLHASTLKPYSPELQQILGQIQSQMGQGDAGQTSRPQLEDQPTIFDKLRNL